MTSALGWQPGDRLTLTAAAGVVIARRDPGGMVTLPAKPYLVIPAALRRRCGLRPGDRVLLAVFPDRDALAALDCPPLYATFSVLYFTLSNGSVDSGLRCGRTRAHNRDSRPRDLDADKSRQVAPGTSGPSGNARGD
jgi:hypothetical protein